MPEGRLTVGACLTHPHLPALVPRPQAVMLSDINLLMARVILLKELVPSGEQGRRPTGVM